MILLMIMVKMSALSLIRNRQEHCPVYGESGAYYVLLAMDAVDVVMNLIIVCDCFDTVTNH